MTSGYSRVDAEMRPRDATMTLRHVGVVERRTDGLHRDLSAA